MDGTIEPMDALLTGLERLNPSLFDMLLATTETLNASHHRLTVEIPKQLEDEHEGNPV